MQRAARVVFHDQDVAPRRPFERGAVASPDRSAVRWDSESSARRRGTRFAVRRRARACQTRSRSSRSMPSASWRMPTQRRRRTLLNAVIAPAMCGQLHQDDVAGIDEHAGAEIRPCCEPVVTTISVDAGRDIADRRVSAAAPRPAAGIRASARIEHGRVRPVEHRRGDVAKFVPREDVRRREPRSERNQVRSSAGRARPSSGWPTPASWPPRANRVCRS